MTLKQERIRLEREARFVRQQMYSPAGQAAGRTLAELHALQDRREAIAARLRLVNAALRA